MTVLLYIYHEGISRRVDFATVKKTLSSQSIEVDKIDVSELDHYLAQNEAHLVLIEKETMTKVPELELMLYGYEHYREVPTYIVVSRQSKLEPELEHSMLSLFGVLKKPIAADSFVSLTQVALLFEKACILKTSVFIDDVTGLYNRTLFRRRTAELIANSVRRHHTLSLVLFDIDNFSVISEEYPVQVEHSVLRDIGTILADSIRREDFIARLERDRFVVLLEERPDGVASLLARILAIANDREIDIDGEKITINLTAGVAQYKKEMKEDADVFLNLAEIALMYAKTKKRAGFAFSNEIVDISQLSAEADDFGNEL